MADVEDTTCCGLRELSGLFGDPKSNVLAVCEDRYLEEHNSAFIMFSDVYSLGNGRKLAAYIRRNGLGTLTKTRAKRNPNSGNSIMVWVWATNDKNLRAWFKTNS